MKKLIERLAYDELLLGDLVIRCRFTKTDNGSKWRETPFNPINPTFNKRKTMYWDVLRKVAPETNQWGKVEL